MRAYSYLRFSTPEQMAGDSLRRQMDLARDYAERHGLELDDQLSLRDLGVSAFRGKNAATSGATTGALGLFRRAVEDGLVPEGSLLLVENLDRVTRRKPWDALPIFQEIINGGITIVTLMDGKVYSREKLRENPFLIMESLFVMTRANEESDVKSRRLRGAWANKRQNASTKPLTAVCPSWLRLSTERVFEVIPERAAVVRRVYEMAAAGIGQHAIAATLNAEAVPVFGRGTHWHRSFIAKLLKSDAVIGTLVPHEMEYVEVEEPRREAKVKRSRKPLAPVPGYYPIVVDADLYQQVQALTAGGTRRPLRGRHAGKPLANVLGGLAKCPLCGATMTRITKGTTTKAGRPYLVCTKAKAGAGCEYRAVRLDEVERCLVERCEQLIETCPAGGQGGLDDRLMAIEAEMMGTTDALENLTAAIERGGSLTLSHRLREHEAVLERLRREEADLQRQRAASQGPVLSRRLDDLAAALPLLPDKRAEVNLLLRQLVSGVTIDWIDGVLEFDWKHGGDSRLTYAWPDEERLEERQSAGITTT